MKIVVYQGTVNGEWYWHGIAKNGENIMNGSESYATKKNAVRAARRAKFLMIFATIFVENEVLAGQ
jgi:uncharacterized protein YegP (UPF0339 family)